MWEQTQQLFQYYCKFHILCLALHRDNFPFTIFLVFQKSLMKFQMVGISLNTP